jgi:hypothetical protein
MAEVRLGLTTTPKCDVTKDTLEYISTEPGEGRYRGSFAPFGGGTDLSKDDRWLLAASVGYEKFRDERLDIAGGGAAVFRRDFDEVAGSAAIKHKPTGLFAMGVFSISDSDDSNVFGGFNGQDAPTMRAWNVQAGIQRRLDFCSALAAQPAAPTLFFGIAANMILPANTFPAYRLRPRLPVLT